MEAYLRSPFLEGMLLGQGINMTVILVDIAKFPSVGVVPFSCLPSGIEHVSQ